MSHRTRILLIGTALLAAAGMRQAPQETEARALEPVVFNEAFHDHWSDGKAELAGYDLTIERYGKPRRGTAVAIFVTEPFSKVDRVKLERTAGRERHALPVLKLNLVKDFATGIYDYNLMSSVFVALEDFEGRPAGTPTKISFSAQEWCGHVWQQLLVDASSARHEIHSYFEGEGDQKGTIPWPADGMSADCLPLWARGLAAPRLAAGSSREVMLLISLETSRLRHIPLEWTRAKLERAAAPVEITVPAGTFQAEVLTATAGDWRQTFWVEVAAPRRLLQWETSAGEKAALLRSERLEYWKMNGPGFEKELERLGLSSRPPRTN